MADNNVIQLRDMKKDEVFTGYLLVKAAQVRVSSNGSKYLDATLTDASAEMNAKGWNWGELPVPEAGSVVKVRSGITEFGGKLQMRIDRLAPAEQSEIDWTALVPCAPEDPDAMYEQVWLATQTFEDEGLKNLAQQMLLDNKDNLLLWPAALNFHHAQRSGLLYHTLTMLRAAQALLPIYPYLDRSLLLCGVILHDLQKMREISSTQQGIATSYTNEGMLIGHIVMGVAQVDRTARELGLDEERALLIKHMLLSHHERPEYGSPVAPMIPEAEVLHTLDQMDARLFAMVNALLPTQPGDLSERVRALDGRKIYKRSDAIYD